MWPDEGDFPDSLHRVVYVIINKRSFESFMCWNKSNSLSLTPSTHVSQSRKIQAENRRGLEGGGEGGARELEEK